MLLREEIYLKELRQLKERTEQHSLSIGSLNRQLVRGSAVSWETWVFWWITVDDRMV